MGLGAVAAAVLSAVKCPRFRRVTDDRFFLIIEARDKRFLLEQTRQLLAGTEAEAVEEVMD